MSAGGSLLSHIRKPKGDIFCLKVQVRCFPLFCTVKLQEEASDAVHFSYVPYGHGSYIPLSVHLRQCLACECVCVFVCQVKFFIQQVFVECMLYARPYLVSGTQNEINAILTLRESHLLGKQTHEELVFKKAMASTPTLWPL